MKISFHIAKQTFKHTLKMKFACLVPAFLTIFNSGANARNSDIVWGTTGQNIPGYSEVTSRFLKNHAQFFDNHYKNYGFDGKADHAPHDCAIVLGDGKALKFENDAWVRLARSDGCTFNWGNGKYCKNVGGTGQRFAHHQPEIVNYPALITFGYNNNNCKNRYAMSAQKIFQKVKFQDSSRFSSAHSIFIKHEIEARLWRS